MGAEGPVEGSTTHGRSRQLIRGSIASLVAVLCLVAVPDGGVMASSRIAGGAAAADTSPWRSLTATACVSPSECWAVGFEQGAAYGEYSALIQGWNGNAWITVPSPSFPGLQSYLNDVTCVSASECWAVGDDYLATDPNVLYAFIELWNGTVWTAVTAPTSNPLGGVNCVSTTDCWAVGTLQPTAQDAHSQALIEHWDGASWSVTPSPTVTDSTLNAVSCASATYCWATGGVSNELSPPTYLDFFELWNGLSWTVSTPQAVSGEMTHVACASTTECWAIGFNGYEIWQWNGKAWGPYYQSYMDFELNGLTCASATECWGVGTAYNGATYFSTAVERWNGATWSLVSSPNPSASGYGDTLAAVTCVSASACWAVGSSNAEEIYQTGLHELWNGTSWTATVQQDEASVAYDSWHGFADPRASGGTDHATGVAGATASLMFTGTSVTWMYREGTSYGIAAVTIDGVSKGDVDLYASTHRDSGATTFGGLASGSHIIVVSVTGTKDAASSGRTVDVDAFQVGSSVIQDTSPAITYDTWAGVTNSGASGGSYRVSTQPRATSSFTFTGTGIDWITATGPSGGMARVSIDGSTRAFVDLYSASAVSQVVEAFSGLSPGPHTIGVSILPNKNPLSAGTAIVIDAFVIHA